MDTVCMLQTFPPLYCLDMTYQNEMGPPNVGEHSLPGKAKSKMAPSKRCATRSDRRCNSLDVLLLSMVCHRTRQANGKSITAGARNKSNPSAEASHQGENAEDMLMVHVHNWDWVARHAPCDLIIPGRGVASRWAEGMDPPPLSESTKPSYK